MSDTFEEVLGIAPVAVDTNVIVGEIIAQESAVAPVATAVEQDFQYARKNIYATIETCQKALTDLSQLAESAQNARVYEVLGILARTLVEANQQLVGLQKQKKDIEKSDADVPGETTINNNLVLTTAEFSRMLNKSLESNE